MKMNELQESILGTKLSLKNYTDDSEATICLLERKVRKILKILWVS